MTLLNEVRDAYRKLNRQPGFTVGAIASLSIGMSLAIGVFGVVKSVVMRPLPYTDINQIAFVKKTYPLGKRALESRFNLGVIAALGAQASAFQGVAVSSFNTAAWAPDGLNYRDNKLVWMRAVSVTPNFFAVLGVQPLFGRVFNESDAVTDGNIIISHALWTSRFGSSREIIGREVPIASTESGDRLLRHRVIGIMPPGVDYPGRTSVWFVLRPDSIARGAATDTGYARFQAIGRLRDGASFSDATVQASSLFQRIHRDNLARAKYGASVIPLRSEITADLREPLRLWSAAAILVALLCAVNFASMSLARGMRRRGEIAIRSALGANRMAIVRGLMIEALLIATTAGAIATMLASWYLTYSGRMLAGRVLPVPPTIDWVTIAFGVALTIFVGFVFAVAPALELAKVDLRTLLQGEGAASTPRRRDLLGQRALVALQLCLALTAAASVTAVIQADRKFRSLNTWFDYDRIIFADYFRPGPLDRSMTESLRDGAKRTIGVSDVAMRWRERGALIFDDRGQITEWQTILQPVTPNLFEVIGVSLAAGRLPTPEERRVGGFYVVSRELAVRLAGSPRAALGKRIRLNHPGGLREEAMIVGVAPRVGGLRDWGISADVYDLQDWPREGVGAYAGLIVNANGPINSRRNELAAALGHFTRRGIVITTATDKMNEALGITRGRNQFLASVAAFALLLAAVGVFGMTTYTTELRLREFGIRLALGADAPRIARVMVADVWWIAPLGIGIGVVAAGVITSFLNQIYGNPLSPVPLVTLSPGPTIAAALTLLAITFVGMARPLRRVLKLDIMRTVQG